MFIILLFLFSTILNAENKEINTKNFRIIFKEKNEKNAIELASKIEELGEQVFSFLNFKTYKKFSVVIEDNIIENSYVDPLTSKITIIPNTVRNKFIQKNYPFWIEYVFVHELVHAVISHKVGSFPFLPNIFPTASLVPRWFQEGLAVFLETKILEGGRGESDNFLMLIKDAVLRNNFKGLSISLFDGSHSYAYGYSFFDFYEKTYGISNLKDKIENSLSFFPISSFQIFTKGINKKDFYNNWEKSIKFSKVINEVKGTKEFDDYILNIELYAYNDNLYFITENFRKRKFLYSLNEYGTKFILDANNIKTFYPYKALYHIDSVKVKNSPKNLLYKNETFIPEVEDAIKIAVNENEIVYVERKNGEEKLISNLRGLLINNKSFKFGKLFLNDNLLYFDASKEGEVSNYIYSLNLLNGKLKKIVEGESPFIYENFLYFSNFSKNISNIFRISLVDKKIEQITNVAIGAFSPILINKKLYYLNYEKEYYYLYSLDEKDFLKKEETFKNKNRVYIKQIKEVKVEKYKKKFSFFSPIPYFNLQSKSFLTDISLLLKDDIEENSFNIGFGINNLKLSFFSNYEYLDILKFYIAYNTLADGYNILKDEKNREGFYSRLDLTIPLYLQSIRANTKSQLILDTDSKVQMNFTVTKDYKQIFISHVSNLNKNRHANSFGFKVYDFSLKIAVPLSKTVMSFKSPGLSIIKKESKYAKFLGENIALMPKSHYALILNYNLLTPDISLDKGTYGGEFIFSKINFNFSPSIILSEKNILANKFAATLFFGLFSVLPLKNSLGITILNPLSNEFISEIAYNLHFNVEIDL